jgi:hypothetical protein
VQDFNAFLGTLSHKHKIVIPGNHDVLFHRPFYDTHYWRYVTRKIDEEFDSLYVFLMKRVPLSSFYFVVFSYLRYHEQKIAHEDVIQATSNFVLLQDEAVELEGIRFYGTSWVPPYHDWVCLVIAEFDCNFGGTSFACDLPNL